jgi:acetylglutamate kinase
MANTMGTEAWRLKYRKATLETALRNGLVAEAICEVDRTDSKYIRSPYQTAPSVVVQPIAGTYAAAAYTVTNDTLTVTEEFIVAEQVYDFEDTLNNFDIFAARTDDMTYAVMTAIDKYVLNEMLANATGTYTTPTGGFTTAANINVIMSNLASKVAGYSEAYKGMFLVIENTDVPGFVQAQATNGFSFADAALKNGFMNSYMGIDVYVVRTGLFVDAATTTASGSKTWTNSGHRMFGIKSMATYAAPRGVRVEEKSVSGATGKEVVVYGYIGAKVWTPKASLFVDITLA